MFLKLSSFSQEYKCRLTIEAINQQKSKKTKNRIDLDAIKEILTAVFNYNDYVSYIYFLFMWVWTSEPIEKQITSPVLEEILKTATFLGF